MAWAWVGPDGRIRQFKRTGTAHFGGSQAVSATFRLDSVSILRCSREHLRAEQIHRGVNLPDQGPSAPTGARVPSDQRLIATDSSARQFPQETRNQSIDLVRI
jgi:hypothetical protein